jgi:hypothetical protein
MSEGCQTPTGVEDMRMMLWFPAAKRTGAVAAVATALLAGCAASPSITTASRTPTARSNLAAEPSASATAVSPTAWVEVPHFVAANENTYFASVLIPPSWQYVPADRTGNCGTAVCYSGSSDTLQGPEGAVIAIGGPTAMGAGETCTDYAQAQTGAGYHLSGEEPISISGIRTTEYVYIGQQGGVTYAQYIIPLESSLIDCASLHAIAVQSTTDHATIDKIFGSVEFHRSN